MNDEQRAKAMACLGDPAKVDALVADIDEDYRRPDYPREMLVAEVGELRAALAAAREALERTTKAAREMRHRLEGLEK